MRSSAQRASCTGSCRVPFQPRTRFFSRRTARSSPARRVIVEANGTIRSTARRHQATGIRLASAPPCRISTTPTGSCGTCPRSSAPAPPSGASRPVARSLSALRRAGRRGRARGLARAALLMRGSTSELRGDCPLGAGRSGGAADAQPWSWRGPRRVPSVPHCRVRRPRGGSSGSCGWPWGRAGPGSASRSARSRRGSRPTRRAGRTRAGRSSSRARA